MARHLGRLAIAAILLTAGIGHFRSTASFRAQVPPFLPAPELIIYVSGVIELLLAAGLLFLRKQRAYVGVAAAAFFIIIFPGNLSQYFTQTPAFGLDSDTARAVRLLFQPVLIGVALWSTGGWGLVRSFRR